MSSSATELWNAWRESGEIRELAEAWITSPEREWSDDKERLYALFGDSPDPTVTDLDRALATIFAIMQITDESKIHQSLAAGPFEDFLGKHGEVYLDTIHTLALEHRRLRIVLDGVWQGAMPKRVWRRIEVLQERAFS